MPRLKFFLLGHLSITLDDKALITDRRKAQAVLITLACEGTARQRESLADLLWPEFGREQASAYLRRTLWEVNQMLGPGWLEADRSQVQLRQAEQTWIDAREFEQLLSQPSPGLERLERAIDLYRGDFLQGFSLRDSPGFEQWQREQAEALRLRFFSALGAASAAYASQQRWLPAIQTAQRWLSLDNLNEEPYRLLIQWYAQAGQRSQAVKTYQDCARVLEQELGVKPEPATTALFERALRGQIPPPCSPPPARPGAAPKAARSNLPIQPTPFVGRSMELLEIRRLVDDPNCRLLTLLGPGGMGKTRLALEVARRLEQKFAHGVYFIGLSSLSSPHQIVAELASVLELTFSEPTLEGSDHLSQLLEYLRARNVLLVMDNFEHLLNGAHLVSRMLSEAPQVKVLATSRERLNLAEEWLFEIEGMSYPLGGALQGLESYSSIQLFLSAARRNQPGYQLQPPDQHAAARICQLLQGLPLGIELAAAWVRVLTLQQIVERLERSPDFLSSRQRGTPERHRSLRAVFEHSWSLLDDREQQAYSKLAIFKNGFTLHAAGQVAGADPELLTALVDKSMLRHFSGGRFDLHDVLHHYAAEQLQQRPPLLAAVSQAHSAFFLDLLTSHLPLLTGSLLKQAHAALDADFDNIRQALLFAAETEAGETLIGPFFAFISYIETRGRQMEGIDVLKSLQAVLHHSRLSRAADVNLDVLEGTSLVMIGQYELIAEHSAPAQDAFARGWALIDNLPPSYGKALALMLASFGGAAYSGLRVDAQQVERNYQEAVQIFKDCGDRWGLALAYISHADTGTNPDRHKIFYEETLAALEIFTDLGSEWGQAFCYNRLAHFIDWRGDLNTARTYASQAAAIYRQLGDTNRLVSTLFHLGQVETALGNFEQAKACYLEGLAVVTQLGRRYYIAIHQDSLGYLELLQGNLEQAERLFQHSLEMNQQLNNPHGIGMSLSNLGDICLRRGDHARAQQLLHQALNIQMQAGSAWGTVVCLKKLGVALLSQGQVDQARALFRQALGLCASQMFVSEALEVLIYHARAEAALGLTCRAVLTLLAARGNPALPRDAARLLEEDLSLLNNRCSPEELERVRQHGPPGDVKGWIDVELGITPLSMDQVKIAPPP